MKDMTILTIGMILMTWFGIIGVMLGIELIILNLSIPSGYLTHLQTVYLTQIIRIGGSIVLLGGWLWSWFKVMSLLFWKAVKNNV